MSKAILVLDKMPDSCLHCPVGNYSGGAVICSATYFSGDQHETFYPDLKQEYCPLKELPKKLPITADIDYITGYNTGWNDCIEHIEED